MSDDCECVYCKLEDTESRLLAAGDALADAMQTQQEVFGAVTAAGLMALETWRALAREVRKEKGDD